MTHQSHAQAALASHSLLSATKQEHPKPDMCIVNTKGKALPMQYRCTFHQGHSWAGKKAEWSLMLIVRHITALLQPL